MYSLHTTLCIFVHKSLYVMYCNTGSLEMKRKGSAARNFSPKKFTHCNSHVCEHLQQFGTRWSSQSVYIDTINNTIAIQFQKKSVVLPYNYYRIFIVFECICGSSSHDLQTLNLAGNFICNVSYSSSASRSRLDVF